MKTATIKQFPGHTNPPPPPAPTISKTETVERKIMTAMDFLCQRIGRNSRSKLYAEVMSDFARQEAIEFQKWVQENATYSRRLTEQGYRLKSTPFSAYELLSTEQLYDKFKEGNE